MLTGDESTEGLIRTLYPGFARIPVPDLRGARRAWRGPLRPLAAAEEVLAIISDLEADASVNVLEGGVLHHDPDCRRDHSDLWYAERLLRMDVEFDVVLADQGADAHPQVFSVRPEISERTYPTYPHIRGDRLARIDGRELPALCTYLSSDGSLPEDEMMLVHALDFASIFLAKHVVWLRTATLVRLRPGLPPLEVAAGSGIELHFPVPAANSNLRWIGHWPGPVAPHGAAAMFKAIPPAAECPCGSRQVYARCCRPVHEAAVKRESRIAEHQVPARLNCIGSA
jgi:hypothetical protein